MDGHDRVMAAPAGPEAIRPRLEPGLPLRFQRGRRQGLKHPVSDHRNPGRAAAPVALGHIHPLDGQGPPPGRAVLQPGRHIGFLLAGEHDAPVDPGRPAASADLRHPPHAHQSVTAGTEHQLLQIADPGKVPGLRCREDPPPQTPYVFLSLAPVHTVPVQASVLGSVHQIGVQLVPRSGRPDDLVSAGSPDPRQHPFRPGHQPLSGQLCGTTGGGASIRSRFPAAFRPPAFASRVFLRPLGDCAALTAGLPAAATCRTPSGLSRSACDRYDRGGRPLNPGDGGALPASQIRLAGTRRLPAAGPYSPASCNPPAEVLMTRRHRGFTCVHPSGLPQPAAPGWNRSPWAFPRASHPAVTRDARRGGDGPRALDRALRRRHQMTLLRRVPLITVRSTRGALSVLPPAGFPGSPPAPGVRLSAHRALHKPRGSRRSPHAVPGHGVAIFVPR